MGSKKKKIKSVLWENLNKEDFSLGFIHSPCDLHEKSGTG